MQQKLICVGAGRDGTVSLHRIIQHVFDRTDGGRAMHEYCAREFYQAFSEYNETGNDGYAAEIRRMIAECPYDCIVGNGYAAILPLFREQWGPHTKLIHIRRGDRDACVASLVKNSEMFPLGHGHYSSSEGTALKRMAAFHFGEMTKDEWDGMSATAKFGWYYDKTHTLIEEHKGLFADTIDVLTESLNEEHTRRTIAQFAGGGETIVPPQAHLNAQEFDIASIASEHREKAIWLIGRLNWTLLFDDDTYAMEYFLNSFSAWTGYQINGSPQLAGSKQPTPDETAATLARARALLIAAIEDIDQLAKLNLEKQAAAGRH